MQTSSGGAVVICQKTDREVGQEVLSLPDVEEYLLQGKDHYASVLYHPCHEKQKWSAVWHKVMQIPRESGGLHIYSMLANKQSLLKLMSVDTPTATSERWQRWWRSIGFSWLCKSCRNIVIGQLLKPFAFRSFFVWPASQSLHRGLVLHFHGLTSSPPWILASCEDGRYPRSR